MKINKEGRQIIITCALVAIVVTVVSLCFLEGVLRVILPAFCLFKLAFVSMFFREPSRETKTNEDIIYSSCDGEVVAIEQVDENEYIKGKCIQVSVFMSLYNVHVNWYPVAGEVVYFKHHHGKFLVAWHPKSSEENERTTTVVKTKAGQLVLFRQIAGLVARRIVSYAKVGETVEQNTKCGFIKFGSRIDMFLPVDSEVLVKIGDKVVGSQTQLARFK